jgi:hypothetical protein
MEQSSRSTAAFAAPQETVESQVVTIKDEQDGRPVGRTMRWQKCVCPVCHQDHDDLVSFDAPKTARPRRQPCDRCFLADKAPEVVEQYLRLRRAMEPPRTTEASPCSVQAALPFGDAGPETRPKGPVGPWEKFTEDARRPPAGPI